MSAIMHDGERSRSDGGHATIDDVVLAVMSQALGPDAIARVEVRRGVDSDGDRILRITIILNDNLPPDPKRLAAFVRHLRTELDGHDDFPILSFISKSDAGKLVEAA